jgi:hypothetical protein
VFELGHNYPSLGVTADIVEQQVGVVYEKQFFSHDRASKAEYEVVERMLLSKNKSPTR